MSTTNVAFRGRVFATPSALTMLVNGVEIHSGQVGTGSPLDTEIDLVTMTNVTAGANLSVTTSVTSGVVTVGWVLSDNEDYNHDLRISDSILINGLAPEWPASPVDPMPGGTSADPDWGGWFFEIGAGETITFDVTVPTGNTSPT